MLHCTYTRGSVIFQQGSRCRLPLPPNRNKIFHLERKRKIKIAALLDLTFFSVGDTLNDVIERLKNLQSNL